MPLADFVEPSVIGVRRVDPLLEASLFIQTDEQPRPKEHPVRMVIRAALSVLEDHLGHFEQTTHGSLGPHTMESICKKMLECYRECGAYEISELAQSIRGLLKQHE